MKVKESLSNLKLLNFQGQIRKLHFFVSVLYLKINLNTFKAALIYIHS